MILKPHTASDNSAGGESAAIFGVRSGIDSRCLAPVEPVGVLLELTLSQCCLDSSLLSIRCIKWTPSVYRVWVIP